VIFGIIHEHVIFLMKCHSLGSNELCVNHTHNCLIWLFEIFFSTVKQSWKYGCKSKVASKMFMEFNCRLKLNVMKCIFVVHSSNLVVVRCIFLEIHCV